MLGDFGWGPALQERFGPYRARALSPARVVAQHRDAWDLITPDGERRAKLAGKFVHEAAEGAFPVVGDWVATDAAGTTIHGALARTSILQRQSPHGGVQVLCANVDVALITTSLNDDVNPRRLERYLVAARDGGVRAVIVLTKADLVEGDPSEGVAAIAPSAMGAPIVCVSGVTGFGLEQIQAFLKPGETAVLLGSSGVGKSTLLNALMGREVMATAAIRQNDAKGRHTTRHRQMARLGGGALVIDTPGLRELGLVADEDALDDSFEDVTRLLGVCRFSDCQHDKEPGCMVREALETGALSPARLAAYGKLQKELAFERRRTDPAEQAANRRKWKAIATHQKVRLKQKRGPKHWD